MKTHDHDLVQDFDELAHPSQVFDHPREVVSDPDLSLNEKRAILASWASDACAIEAAPALRQTPGGRVVLFDEIMDAMRAVDGELLLCNPCAGDRAKRLRSPSSGACWADKAIRVRRYTRAKHKEKESNSSSCHASDWIS
jgi:hypothetical protein